MGVEDKPVESMEQDVTQKIEDVEMEDLEQVPVATSTAQIENIDQDDVENPQLVVEYVNEIYAYMRYLEDKQSISEEYLSHVKSTIMPKMRAVLVDWLIQVHQQFNLLQETLYLTIAVLDRFLQVHASKVERKQLQLVGVAAMFIASKYEEMYPPKSAISCTLQTALIPNPKSVRWKCESSIPSDSTSVGLCLCTFCAATPRLATWTLSPTPWPSTSWS